MACAPPCLGSPEAHSTHRPRPLHSGAQKTPSPNAQMHRPRCPPNDSALDARLDSSPQTPEGRPRLLKQHTLVPRTQHRNPTSSSLPSFPLRDVASICRFLRPQTSASSLKERLFVTATWSLGASCWLTRQGRQMRHSWAQLGTAGHSRQAGFARAVWCRTTCIQRISCTAFLLCRKTQEK